MKTETVIKPGIACLTKNETEHKAFEAACVAAGYKADEDQYDESPYECSYLSEFGVTQTDKEERFKEVPLENVLFCPSIAPEWAVDVRTSGRQFFWTNNRGRFREIFAGDHEGIFLDRAWHNVEMEIIATRPQEKSEKWMPEVGEECEVLLYPESGAWAGCEIIGPFRNGIVCAPDGGGFRMFSVEMFRPIKTEREKFIEQAGAVFGSASDMGDLYDAGCRFMEEKQ